MSYRNAREWQRTRDDWKMKFSSLRNYLLLGSHREFSRNKMSFWKSGTNLSWNIHRISAFWELRGNFPVYPVCLNLLTLYLKLQGADVWGAKGDKLMRNIRLHQLPVDHLMESSPNLSSMCKSMKTGLCLHYCFTTETSFFLIWSKLLSMLGPNALPEEVGII